MRQDLCLLMSIYQTAEQIVDTTNHCTKERFLSSIQLQTAAIIKLLAAAESAKALTAQTYQSLPQVAGKALGDLRDGLVDDDDNIDPEQLWQVVSQEMPLLAADLKFRVPPHV